MLPGMNPRKMQQMMRQLGIQQQELPAEEVLIKMKDKIIVITNPSVQKVNMMGQETFQISGEIEERELSEKAEISEDDVETVMAQAKVSREQAVAALEEADGDLAQAILNLNSEE